MTHLQIMIKTYASHLYIGVDHKLKKLYSHLLGSAAEGHQEAAAAQEAAIELSHRRSTLCQAQELGPG